MSSFSSSESINLLILNKHLLSENKKQKGSANGSLIREVRGQQLDKKAKVTQTTTLYKCAAQKSTSERNDEANWSKIQEVE